MGPLPSLSYAEHKRSTAPKQLLQNTLPNRLSINNITTKDAPVLGLDFKRERDRQKTYINWPLSFLDPDKLAAAGFYYLEMADIVRCAFCQVEIGRWEEDDDPMRDHQRWSPNCPFLKNQNVGNAPFSLEEAPSTSTLLTQGGNTCGQYQIPVAQLFSGPENGLHGTHKSTGPLHKDYSTKEARLRSYEYWPVALKQKPNVLSDAGFYYTGTGDQTKCFDCKIVVNNWEDSDDPWVEHASWSSKCSFVCLMKGLPFIDQCAEKQAQRTEKEAQELESPSELLSDTLAIQEVEPPIPVVTAEPVSNETEESNSRKLDDNRLCKICFHKERGVLFLPCGHMIACVHCVPDLSKCAACHQPIMATVRAYLS